MANKASSLLMFRSKISSPRWLSSSAATATIDKEQTLFRKLSVFAGGEVKVADTLDEWVKEGNPIKRYDIISIVNMLRRNRKYQRAIELYQWMEKSKNDSQMNNADRAICIDLISKTEGVASAEKYFNGLQESAKTKKTYGALLSCYCKNKMSDKAVELFETMKELNFVSSLNYNNMMFLYIGVGQAEKAISLSKEMEEKGIPADLYTYNHIMNSYAALGDYETVEKIVGKMEKDKVKRDWFTYGNLATIYVNAGLIEKANATLLKLESMENLHDREAFHTLMNLYARTSNLSGVYRAWESLKSAFPKTMNVSYLIKLLALSKLGDMEGLEKTFREWESSCSTYDVRVPNVILESYLKRDMITEANVIYEDIEKRGATPNLRTVDIFTNFYLRKQQMDSAFKFLEMGASKMKQVKDHWYPTYETVYKFLQYFEENKDVENAEKFYESMKKIGRLDSKVYDSLIRTYIAAGKVEPQMLQRLKDDNIVFSPETEELLSELCSE